VDLKLSRREFIKAMGGSGLLYAVRFTPSAQTGHSRQGIQDTMALHEHEGIFGCEADDPMVDYSDWIVLRPDGTVTIFTGRVELGQGLKTVLTAIVSQGLEIPPDRVEVILGDTDLCPDDGPTVGSGATWQVGWGFWLACEKIREDLVYRAATALNLNAQDLEYKESGINSKQSANTLANAFELGSGETVFLQIDQKSASSQKKLYVDPGIPNVQGEKIVTGQLKYAGDVDMPDVHYAGWLIPPYHPRLTRLQTYNLEPAKAYPGVKVVITDGRRIAAVADRFRTVHKALAQVKATWSQPDRPKVLDIEKEARDQAELNAIREDEGDVELGLAQSDLIVSETYMTQYTTQAPLETHTASAQVNPKSKQATVYTSSQYPHYGKEIVAKFLQQSDYNTRIIGMPAGGAFGGKTQPPVIGSAALLSKLAGTPVKFIYTMKDQFQRLGTYKYAVVVDLTTGVKADGRMVARKIDIYQDVGHGTDNIYRIPNVLTKNFQAREWPFDLAISRGTSFVQDGFATESHIDMVAHAIGMDPLKFRVMNTQHAAFMGLLAICSDRLGYKDYQPDIDEGIGFGLANHGGLQLGAVAAKVKVDRSTGKVNPLKIHAAFDVGPIMSRRTAEVGVRGGIIWGIGYALHEEIKLDGHGPYTSNFLDYHIPRFSDVPEIDVDFINSHHRQPRPRGCGELPVIPTIGAIANAVYNAIGIRFYSTPITPEKVLNALNS
jgi:isoquinoline 1-oxidoreductase